MGFASETAFYGCGSMDDPTSNPRIPRTVLVLGNNISHEMIMVGRRPIIVGVHKKVVYKVSDLLKMTDSWKVEEIDMV